MVLGLAQPLGEYISKSASQVALFAYSPVCETLNTSIYLWFYICRIVKEIFRIKVYESDQSGDPLSGVVRNVNYICKYVSFIYKSSTMDSLITKVYTILYIYIYISSSADGGLPCNIKVYYVTLKNRSYYSDYIKLFFILTYQYYFFFIENKYLAV